MLAEDPIALTIYIFWIFCPNSSVRHAADHVFNSISGVYEMTFFILLVVYMIGRMMLVVLVVGLYGTESTLCPTRIKR